MLDIDVATQLFPDPLTAITQLCATLVLFLIFRHFLWDAVKMWMQKRQAFLDSEVKVARENAAETENELSAARSKVKDAVIRSNNIISKAEKDGNVLREEILLNAKKDAERKIERAKEEILQQQREAENDMRKEIIEVAMSATEKLVGKNTNSNDDRIELDKLLKELES